MFPSRIETERLVLSQLCHQNVSVDELYGLFNVKNGSDVFEHIPDEPYRTVNEAYDRIEGAEKRWANRTAVEYAIRPKESENETGQLAGTANLSCKWKRQTGQLGILLGRRFWGRGYAGERAAALLALSFDRLDIDLVSAACRDGNEKSKQAIEQYIHTYGGQYDGLLRNWLPMDEGVADLHRYTITQEQYESSNTTNNGIEFINELRAQ